MFWHRTGLFRASLQKWAATLRDALARQEAWDEEQDDSEEIARVRLTAELAADRLARGEIAVVTNPWKCGTRYFVLWETSHHARLLQVSPPPREPQSNSGTASGACPPGQYA